MMKMKRDMRLLSALLVIVLCVVTLTSCANVKFDGTNHSENSKGTETKEESASWNAFSTIGDLSEITWYLQQVHGISDFGSCRYYDFDNMSEAALVYVQFPGTDDTPGTFLMFGYDRDLEDYGAIRYEGIPYEETGRQEMGTDIEGNTVWKINFQSSDGGVQDAVYMTFDEEGRIRRLLDRMFIQEYFYNPDGTVSQMERREAAADSWTTDENNYDFVSGNYLSEDRRIRWKYEYNPDGSLHMVYIGVEPEYLEYWGDYGASVIEEEGLTYFQCQSFEYDENGFRTEITDYEFGVDTLTYTRDAQGRITDHTLVMDDDEAIEEGAHHYTYLPDGSVEVEYYE